MNIHPLVRGWSMQSDVGRQLLAGHKRKRWSGCFTDAAMTLRADINLLLSWQADRGHLFSVGTTLSARSLLSNVVDSRPVAPLARNSQCEVAPIEAIVGRRRANRLKVCCVAFHAPWRYGTVKVRGSIHIARTVDPTSQFGPIRNWQLK